jgi:3-methylcrotonyl-CoA carboxylase alpha subunit
MQKIIEIAKKSQSKFIHPGFGFLSENEIFCNLCKENDIIFVGPPVEAINLMGSK